MQLRLKLLGFWDFIESRLLEGPKPVVNPVAVYRKALEEWETAEKLRKVKITQNGDRSSSGEQTPKPAPPEDEEVNQYQRDKSTRISLMLILDQNVSPFIQSHHIRSKHRFSLGEDHRDPVVVWKELEDKYGDRNSQVRGRLYRRLRQIPSQQNLTVNNALERMDEYFWLCRRYINSLPPAGSSADNSTITSALSQSLAYDFVISVRQAQDDELSTLAVGLSVLDKIDLETVSETLRPGVMSIRTLREINKEAERRQNPRGGGRGGGRGGRGRGRGGRGGN